jgi:uncharacterized protein
VTATNLKGRQGFASMNSELQRQIASKGGQTAHRTGRAHQWTREEARAAGRKGGRAASQRRRLAAAAAASMVPTLDSAAASGTSCDPRSEV